MRGLRGIATFYWGCLVALSRLVTGRRGVPAGGTAIPYGGQERALAVIMVPVGTIECVVTALLTRGTPVEAVLDVVDAALLLLLLGLLARYTVYPHVVSHHGVQIRVLGMLDLTVPLQSIASVRAASLTGVLGNASEPDTFDVPLKGRLDLVLTLVAPEVLSGQRAVRCIRCAADSPKEAVAEIRQHLSAAGSAGLEDLPTGTTT